MKNYLSTLLLFIGLALNAQTEKVLTTAGTMPVFPGGKDAITSYIAKNKTVPATLAPEAKKAEPVVKFVVDAEGKVKDAVIVKSSGYKQLDEEAVRLISTMPQWTPGMEKNKKVNVSMTMPVSLGDNGAATINGK